MTFSTTEYTRSHQKAPRGRGTWAFISQSGEFVAAPSRLTLAEAKAWIKEQVKAGTIAPSAIWQVAP
jgi:hypothetical protein